MDDLRIRDDAVRRIERGVQILHDALCHARRRAVQRGDRGQRAVGIPLVAVQRRHIHALDLRHGAEKFRSAPALAFGAAIELQNFRRALLALADGEEIDEIRQRLRVIYACAARKDHMLQSRAVGRMQRHAGQAQHIEHVRVAHLIADGKGNEVELRHRVAALKRIQRQAVCAHGILHITPRGKDALTPHALHAVHDRIEDAHAEIRHADLIGIRKAEGNAQLNAALVLHRLSIFPAHIARRLLYGGQNAFQLFCHKASLLDETQQILAILRHAELLPPCCDLLI